MEFESVSCEREKISVHSPVTSSVSRPYENFTPVAHLRERVLRKSDLPRLFSKPIYPRAMLVPVKLRAKNALFGFFTHQLPAFVRTFTHQSCESSRSWVLLRHCFSVHRVWLGFSSFVRAQSVCRFKKLTTAD
jgi:hypothetical protein